MQWDQTDMFYCCADRSSFSALGWIYCGRKYANVFRFELIRLVISISSK